MASVLLRWIVFFLVLASSEAFSARSSAAQHRGSGIETRHLCPATRHAYLQGRREARGVLMRGRLVPDEGGGEQSTIFCGQESRHGNHRAPSCNTNKRRADIGLAASPANIEYMHTRRNLVGIISALSSLVLISGERRPADALPFIGGGAEDKRQLELCLVTVLRVRYWANSIAESLDKVIRITRQSPGGLTDSMKQPYLEARLGSKALLTGRIGGGATSKVYTLASFQIKGCLKDAGWWLATKASDKKQRVASARDYDAVSEAIVDSLAACVEFDGLETTLDPSPRSSLMLSAYTDQKATFVMRMLQERLVPSCDTLVGLFDGEVRDRCMRYMRENYGSEMPPQLSPPPVEVKL